MTNESLPGFYPATAMPDADWWQVLWPTPADVLTSLGVRAGMVAVDLCCGDGLFTAPLTDIVRHVFAVDIDPQMLALANSRLTAGASKRCRFIQGDAYDLPRQVSDRIDYVLMANTFHGVPDKTRLSFAVSAVLRTGGKFAVVNWHRCPREDTVVLGRPRGPKTEMRIESAEVAEAVEKTGLWLREVIELPPYHYGAVFEKIA